MTFAARKRKMGRAGLWYLSTSALCLVMPGISALAQEAQPFKDVPASSSAYQTLTDLQSRGLLIGYADGYFTGKRVLTRYEFAIALKRALGTLFQPSTTGSADSDKEAARAIARLEARDVTALHGLLQEFSGELKSVGIDVSASDTRLSSLHLKSDSGPHPGSDLNLPGGTTDRFNSGSQLSLPNGSNGMPRSLFGGSPNNPLSINSIFSTQRERSNSLTDGTIGAPRSLTGRQNSSLHLDVPLWSFGQIGLSRTDFSAGSSLALMDPSSFGTTLYGANMSVNPLRHFTVSAEALRADNSQATDSTDSDTSVYGLKLGYRSHGVTASLSYQYLNSNFLVPGSLRAPGGIAVPGAFGLQGPSLQLSYNFSNRINAFVGGDLYSGAGGANDPLAGSNIIRSRAGFKWNPNQRFSLSAAYEGVFYDLTDAYSLNSGRTSPIGQYITLGAGLNLTRNAVLKLAYQINSSQDLTYGSLLGPSRTSNTSVFTTQLAVHF